MERMFFGSQVKSVELDDTSSVTTMQEMFRDAEKFN